MKEILGLIIKISKWAVALFVFVSVVLPISIVVLYFIVSVIQIMLGADVTVLDELAIQLEAQQ